MSPADIHALSMVAILGFALGSVLTLFLVMARNAKKNRDLPEPSDFQESENPKSTPSGNSNDSQKPQPWEKEADWWKKN